MILEHINKASDIRDVKPEDYPRLAREIRDFLIEKTSINGGHLASNLGVVELTMAIYLSFELPKDKIIWDVGHQSYTHKILSGRKDAFDDLRKYGGIAGFPKTFESPCDAFNTGHSSTSISAGLGIAQARDIKDQDYYVVPIIGDGALTGGMAYEALNNASRMKKNFIIILNDNNMSISENVGGISNYLSGIRTAGSYNNLKRHVERVLGRVPVVGYSMIEGIKQTKNGIKQLLIPGMFFEDMGITYLGPVDGHNISAMCKIFKEAKRLDHAVIVHVLTKKGKGYAPAERDPSAFHGVGPFDIATGKPKKKKEYPDYTDIFSDTICEIANKDPNIVAVTAAMPDGTGLKKFSKEYPDRFFDVGIAEQHAITSAAGMAAGGLKPVVAVYSSFLQRGYDQILHDICIQNLHVVLAVDRAGLVGADGETHQGIFDLSYLSSIPNMTVLAPKNDKELRAMIYLATEKYNGPIAIRYPRGEAYRGLSEFDAPISFGKGELLYDESDIAILAVGSMVSTGEHVRQKLKKAGYKCSLANGRFIKPIDTKLIDELIKKHHTIITMEENVLVGGYGLSVSDYIYQKTSDIRLIHISIPDAYVEHGDVSLLRHELHIDSDSVIEIIKDKLGLDI